MRECVLEETKKRTLSQNRALHLWFEFVAAQLNGAGLDMRRTLAQDIEIPWNKDTVKEMLYKPVMEAQTGKDSTTDLTTKELSQVAETITRHLAQKLGIDIEFPSEESLVREDP